MANVKITELTAATALAGTDVLPIVDVGADATKKVSVSDLLRNLPDGTVSAPALAFADDQNTGVYSPAANELAFATSGTQRLVINSTGQIDINSNCRIEEDGLFKASNGSAAAPSHAFLNDPDNGMFRATTNTLGFSTGGSERLRIDSSGRLGIGTSSPNNELHVSGSGAFSGTASSLSNDQVQIGFAAPEGFIKAKNSSGSPAANLGLYTTNGSGTTSKIVHVSYDGNVGVGVTPGTKFHVKGDNNLNVCIIDAQGTAPNYILDVRDDGTSKFRVNGAGNVGIGTSSPSSPLHVKNAGSTACRFILENSGSASDDSTQIWSQNNDLAFNTNDSERMRIDSSGNVGIGTTSIDNKLHVASSVSAVVKYECTSGTSTYTKFENTDNARGFVGYEGKRLVFYADNGSNTGDVRVAFMDADGLKFGGDTAAANALHDYEEGTWTATINTTNSNATVSANNTTGYYVKVGSMVTAYYYSANVNITAVGSGAGIITGLPFTVANLSNGFATATVTHATIFSSQIQNGYADLNDTRIVFVGEGSTSGIGLTTGNPLYVMVSLTYRAG
tara:strand:- start:68 stop:1750 length:1683 start_codon:yes stop_codon:yes gene_type:complete